MNTIVKILFLIFISQLAACATLSEQECLQSDWRQLGYDVALKGGDNVISSFEKYQRACLKFGAKPDFELFKQGHSDGIVKFCQLGNAVELGIRGRTKFIDKQSCPARDYPNFLAAFEVGYRLFELRNQARDSTAELNSALSKRKRLKQEIRKIGNDLKANDLDKFKRKKLLSKSRDLWDQISYIDKDIKRHKQLSVSDAARASRYSRYVRQDYLKTYDDEFIDPRIDNDKKNTN